MLWFTKLRTTYEFLLVIYYPCKSQFLETAAIYLFIYLLSTLIEDKSMFPKQ